MISMVYLTREAIGVAIKRVKCFMLSDPYLVSDKTLDLVINALIIAREGYGATGVNKHFE